ncbi:hypothetical protein D3C75_975960 [compost metagenome]
MGQVELRTGLEKPQQQEEQRGGKCKLEHQLGFPGNPVGILESRFFEVVGKPDQTEQQEGSAQENHQRPRVGDDGHRHANQQDHACHQGSSAFGLMIGRKLRTDGLGQPQRPQAPNQDGGK